MIVFSASLTVYVPKLATSPVTTALYSSALTWSILLAPNLGRSERVMNCATLPFPSNMKMPFGSEPQRLLLVPSAFTSSAETKVQVPTICFLSVFPFCCARAVPATPASIAPTSIVSANLRCAVMAVLPRDVAQSGSALRPPVSPMVWVPALSVIVTLPEAEPAAVGANVTWMVHDAAGAMLPLQLFVWLNGAVVTMLVTCSGPVPVLCSVMFFAVLVVPTACDGKDNVAGVTAAPGVVPVPSSGTACVEPRFPESSVTVSAPVTGPTTCGVNATDTVQFDPADRVAGQLSVSENPPPAARLNPFSGLPPTFAMVMVCGALVVPVFCENVSVGGEKPIAEGRGAGSGTGVAPKT